MTRTRRSIEYAFNVASPKTEFYARRYSQIRQWGASTLAS
jgi:hypothetical protein